ncbi:efflux RND transporter periplasmic adaptor subunit [Chitinophaga japonensis]|uniref:HlyD family secretion protein n=1 Tax=Chitinophaga japonensis TaxID=104662 RepID=A0A562T0D2_CHIJA|nr:efflux RND transporter periplasmic adaptor subunit [Chitinophaga japonensis]TWI86987.1 HlyD family secretion protein [Chitinophaga japonensis]
MKKHYIVKTGTLLCVAALLLAACGQQEQAPSQDRHGAAHQYVTDTALAPLLQPVNEQVIAQIGAVRPEQGGGAITREIQGVAVYDTRSETSMAARVAGRIERLYIRYNYQPVRKGQLIMEIYSPELVAAQRELLYIAETGTDPALLGRARQRLLLLGMTAQQLEQVLRTKKPLYKVPLYSNANGYIIDKAARAATAAAVPAPSASGDGMGAMGAAPAMPAAPAAPAANTPVLLREGQYVSAGQSLFTIYKADKLVAEFALEPAIAAYIRKGLPVALQSLAGGGPEVSATIGLVQPVIRNGENFTLVRVYLSGQPFKAGALLKGQVAVPAPEGWWLPEAAVVQLGNRSVVFKKEGRVYRPVSFPAGLKANGRIQVPDSLAGWEVARNAYYLVDSESFIRTAAASQKQ